MGAKQSKRSVDISGKEAESAGEVAASIAGGEGRMEPLADADALKPQLNGDAHIHDTEEKLKDVDSGTPENEKDATTEKETKQQDEDKEGSPLTNGESEQKVENGESTPTPEDGKKPKKEKVKKKWSLRSISFSRKDKPKQDKKPKDEEPKINGEPEKVPEETADVASEVPVVSETTEEAKPTTEIKEDKTPETPVTEPITNGSSTPDSPKAQTPVVEEPAAPSPVPERTESKTAVEPEQLPVNGLSIEDNPTKETTENVKNEDSKEVPIAETTETVPEIIVKKEVCVEQMSLIDSTPPPLPANPPPSSVASFAATTMAPELSDASLANTADNATLPPPSPPSDSVVTYTDDEISSKSETNLIVAQTVSNDTNDLSSPLKKIVSEVISHSVTENGVEHDPKQTIILTTIPIECNKLTSVDNANTENSVIEKLLFEKAKVSPGPEMLSSQPKIIEPEISCKLVKEPLIDTEEVSIKLQSDLSASSGSDTVIEKEHSSQKKLLEYTELEVPPPPPELIEGTEIEKAELDVITSVEDTIIEKQVENSESGMPAHDFVVFSDTDGNNTVDNLPDPPPPLSDEAIYLGEGVETSSVQDKNDIKSDITDVTVNSADILDAEEAYDKREEHKSDNETFEQNSIKKTTDSLLSGKGEIIECNGNSNIETTEIMSEISAKQIAEIAPPANSKDMTNLESDRTGTSPDGDEATSAAGDADDSLPPPPSELCRPDASPDLSPDHAPPQEPLPVSDKLADLITEVPEVPELKTETETTSGDGGVAN